MHNQRLFAMLTATVLAAGVIGSTPAMAFEPLKTKVIRGGESAQSLSVDVSGLKDLYLEATIGGDTYNYDQAIWAEPKLVAKDGSAVDLTTLKPQEAHVGWGELLVNNRAAAPLSIAGKTYNKGFWAHAPSVLHFKLDGAYVRFEAQVGIDTMAGKNGSVEFVVTNVAPKTNSKPPVPGPAPVTKNLSPADKAPHKFNADAAKLLVSQGIDKLVFVRRFTLTCSHVYTEFLDARWTPGGGLCVLDLKSGAVTPLLPELGEGVVNRFDLSFDAKKIVFDYKKSAKDGYRIYEADIDGKNLRQLSFPDEDEGDLMRRYGVGSNDMHPCYLPNGEIIFTSTRCQASVLCDGGDGFKTTVLYRMDGNGKNLHRLSYNCVSEFSPAVLPDGRILYMRWEYNRKGAGAVKCLWAMFPDGSSTAEVYGDNIVDPETMIYGRPIPGSPDKISFLGCSHWGPNNGVGTVIVLDTKVDAQSRSAMKFITKDIDAQTHGGYSFLVDGKWVHESTGTLGRLFKDPYPISENLFLVSQKPKGLYWHDPKGYDLCLLNEEGKETLLYQDEEISCWHPYPLRARVKPSMPPAAPTQKELASKNLAHCMVADVYTGMTGVPRGTVKYLRIVEQTPRPWAARARWQGDHEGMAHSTVGYGILGMQAQHGVVPVEEDGSASFYVPAGRNIYLQALDENYRSIQIERTYINYVAGETRSCVGCHDRAHTSSTGNFNSAKAFRREPSMPGPQPGEASGQKLYDYARQIQPIWDKHCVSCHSGTPTATAKLDLTGELTERYCRSYENLMGHGTDKNKKPRFTLVGSQVDENDVRAFVEYTPPYFFGANTSLLLATFDKFEPHFDRFGATAAQMKTELVTLRDQHKEVKLSREELVRIANWLDASCQYYGSYWGMKNIAHRQSPYFRPEVSFDEALSGQFPATLRAAYDPKP